MAEDRRETELSFWQARRNRSVATWVSTLTVAMLLVVAVLSRNILLEQWYLRQAHSADREAAIAAMGSLGELGSTRAIERLLAHPVKNDGAWRQLAAAYGEVAFTRNLRQIVPVLVATFEPTDDDSSRSVAAARAITLLEMFGREAGAAVVPVLRDFGAMRQDEKARVAEVLGSVVANDSSVFVLAATALEHRDEDLSLVLRHVMEQRAANDPQSLPQLIEALGDPTVNVRLKVTEIIGDLGASARDAIPQLTKRVHDREPEVRYAAIRGLGRMGDESLPHVNLFVQAFDDPAPRVRDIATRVLARLSSTHPEVIATIATALYAKSSQRREHSIRTLTQTGKDLEFYADSIAARCSDEAKAVRLAAVEALGTLNSKSDAVSEALRKALSSPDTEIRDGAAFAMGMARPSENVVSKHLQALAVALSDPEPTVSESAAASLRTLAPLYAEDVARVAQGALEAGPPEPIRRQLLYVLVACGASGERILIDSLRDPSTDVRMTAILSLQDTEVALTELLPHLKPGFEDDTVGVREATSQTIAEIVKSSGDSAQIDLLVRGLQSENTQERAGIALALAYLGGFAAPATSELTSLLEDSNAKVRENAAIALGELGRAAAPAVPGLVLALADEDPAVVDAVSKSIGRLALSDEATANAALQGVEKKSVRVRSGLLEALAMADLKTAPVATAYFEALNAPEAELRLTAARILGEFTEPPTGTLEALRARVSDPDAYVRRAVVRAIGSLSVPAEDAIPDLVLTLEDPVAEVKNAAEEALTTILEQQPELHAQMEAAKGQASAAARATLERILASVAADVVSE